MVYMVNVPLLIVFTILFIPSIVVLQRLVATVYRRNRNQGEIIFYTLLCLEALIVIWLNWHGEGMQGILDRYQYFKRIILAGFDLSQDTIGNPTFPMWGYGWLMILTENKLLLLIINNVLAIITIYFILGIAEKKLRIPEKQILYIRTILLVSLPFFAFQSLRWPYSVATSLTVLSVFILAGELKERDKGRLRTLVFSGVLFGIALNFRSDYFLFPLAAVVVLGAFKRHTVQRSLFWLVSVYVMLVPWMLYTKKATGHFLLTSTNSGHVLFIGLGILPGNEWGIIPHDGDPHMHQLLDKEFGEGSSSLVYESDKYLKAKYFEYVREQPGEYLKKVLYSAFLFATTGVYPGEFHERIESFDAKLGTVTNLRQNRINTIGEMTILILYVLSRKVGQAIILVTVLFLPVFMYKSIKLRDVFYLAILLIILYQAALNILAYQSTSYTANIYIYAVVVWSVLLYSAEPHLVKLKIGKR